MQNCVFTGNSASQGGAAACNSNTLITLANCTLFHNFAGSGGGVYTAAQSQSADNCILWGNMPDQINDNSHPTIVRNTNIQGGWTGPGGNNINSDPLFVDADGPDNIPGTEDDDLRLAPGSPSIDAGYNALVLPDIADLDGDGNTIEATPLDLDRNPRFADDLLAPNTGCGLPVIVDQGAYEKPGVPTPITIITGDVNGDGHVNVDDLLQVITQWGPCPVAGCCPADTNADTVVNVADLLTVINNWG